MRRVDVQVGRHAAIFMESLVRPDRLRARILMWAEEEIGIGALPPKAGNLLLEAVLYRGELPRGDAGAAVGTGERQARRIVSALVEAGVLTSENPRAPLRLVFRIGIGGTIDARTFRDQAA